MEKSNFSFVNSFQPLLSSLSICSQGLSASMPKHDRHHLDETPQDTNARIDRIMMNKSVIGMVIATPESNPLRTNFDSATTMLHTRTIRPIVIQALCAVRDLDPYDNLTAIRVRTRTLEYLVTISDGFLIVCIQTLANTY